MGERARSPFGRLLLWPTEGSMRGQEVKWTNPGWEDCGRGARTVVSSEVLRRGPGTLIPDSALELEAGKRRQSEGAVRGWLGRDT